MLANVHMSTAGILVEIDLKQGRLRHDIDQGSGSLYRSFGKRAGQSKWISSRPPSIEFDKKFHRLGLRSSPCVKIPQLVLIVKMSNENLVKQFNIRRRRQKFALLLTLVAVVAMAFIVPTEMPRNFLLSLFSVLGLFGLYYFLNWRCPFCRASLSNRNGALWNVYDLNFCSKCGGSFIDGEIASQEILEVNRNKFNRKKMRCRICVSLLLICVGTIFILMVFGSSGYSLSSSMKIFLFLVLFPMTMAGMLGIAYDWKCPSCSEHLCGMNPRFCNMCGIRLH